MLAVGNTQPSYGSNNISFTASSNPLAGTYGK